MILYIITLSLLPVRLRYVVLVFFYFSHHTLIRSCPRYSYFVQKTPGQFCCRMRQGNARVSTSPLSAAQAHAAGAKGAKNQRESLPGLPGPMFTVVKMSELSTNPPRKCFLIGPLKHHQNVSFKSLNDVKFIKS